jgi:predicted RNase H-like nuclease
LISLGSGTEKKAFVAGVDGCKAGWVVVLLELDGDRAVESERCRVVPNFDHVVKLPESPRFIGVDIPIGLPVIAVPGGRACDREARKLLGRKRGASVFAPPVRAALAADSYERAMQLNRSSSKHNIGLSRQVYGLLPKLREVHDAMNPELQLRIREVHPELSFAAMNDLEPMKHSKRTERGREERLQLLERYFPDVGGALECTTAKGVDRNDVVDAYAAAWSAWRMATGKATYLPRQPELDSRGLRMGIWY